MAGWLPKKIMAKRLRRKPRRWTKLLGFFLLLACIAWGFLLFWVWPRVPDWISQEVSRLANGRLTIDSIRLRPGALTLHEVCFRAGPDKQPAMSHLRVDIAAVRVGFDLKWGEKPGLSWLRVISVDGVRLEADMTRSSWTMWVDSFASADPSADTEKQALDLTSLVLPELVLDVSRAGVRTTAGRWELLASRLEITPGEVPGQIELELSSDGMNLPEAWPVVGEFIQECVIECSLQASEREYVVDDFNLYVKNLPRLMRTKLALHRQSGQMLASGLLTSELGYGYLDWWISFDGAELESANVKVSQLHPLNWVSLIFPAHRAAFDRWVEDDGVWSGALSILGSTQGNYSVSGNLQAIGVYPRDRPRANLDLGLDGRWFNRYLELDLRTVLQGDDSHDLLHADGSLDWAFGMESPRWSYDVSGELSHCMDWAGPEVTRFPWQAEFLWIQGRGASGIGDGAVLFDGEVAASDVAWNGIWIGPLHGLLRVEPGLVQWDPAILFDPGLPGPDAQPLQAGGCIEWGSGEPWHLAVEANTGVGRISLMELFGRFPTELGWPEALGATDLLVSGGGYLDWQGGHAPWVRVDAEGSAEGQVGPWARGGATIDGHGSLQGDWSLERLSILASGGSAPTLELFAGGSGHLDGLSRGDGILTHLSLAMDGWPLRLLEPAIWEWAPGRVAVPGLAITEGLGGSAWFAGTWGGADAWDVQGYLKDLRLDPYLPAGLRSAEPEPWSTNAEFGFFNRGDGLDGGLSVQLDGRFPIDTQWFPKLDPTFRLGLELMCVGESIVIPGVRMRTAHGELGGWAELNVAENENGERVRTLRAGADVTPIELRRFDQLLTRDLRIYSGDLRLHARAEGPLNDLCYSVSAGLLDGLVRYGSELPPWEQIQADLQLEPGFIRIHEARASAGGGSANMQGVALLSENRLHDLQLDLGLDHFLFLRKPDIRVRSSGTVQLGGVLPDLELSGDLEIVDGAFTQNVPLPRFHQLLRRTPSSVMVQQAPIRPIPMPRVATDSPLGRIGLNLNLGANRFRLRNNVVSTWLDAFLTLGGDLASPLLLGQISTTEGNLFLPLTRMLIDQMYIRFTPENPNVPMLDFLGEGNFGGYTVELEARGPATRPEIQLTSDPALPTQDVLWLLTTGRLRDRGGPMAADGAGQASVGTSAGFMIGRGAVQEIVKDYGGEMGDWLTRLEIVTRPNDSLPEREIVDAEYRLNGGFSLIGGRDQYGDYNGGVLWRLKIR